MSEEVKIVAFACDHGGYELKDQLVKFVEDTTPLKILDLGCHGPDSVDYPDFANKLADAIKDGHAQQGVLICGSGIGISIAANRFKHIRAALCNNSTDARLARQHNNANVICFGARTMGVEVIKDSLTTFLQTDFDGGRHERRVGKMS